jgi:hypothetical protein
MKVRKLLIRVLFVLLAVVAAVLVVRAVLNFTEGRRLTRTLAGLKGQGIPLTAKELNPPCPESENGATLWKAAEELYAFEGEDNKLITKIYQAFVRNEVISPEEWSALTKVIEKNRRMLDLIPEVAAKPRFQYGDRELSFSERRIPDALKILRSIRLLGFEAFMAAEKGDVRSSLDRLRAGLRFAPKIAEESSLIAYLVALASEKQGLLFLNKSLSGREAGEELLLPLLNDLDERQIELWKSLLRNGIRGERIMFTEIGLLTDAKGWATSSWLKGEAEKLFFWLIKPLIKRDINQNLPIYAGLEANAGLPYYRTRDFWKPYQDRLKDLPWYAVVSKLAIPEMEATFMKTATFEALVRATRAGLACRTYKGRTGEYPESLEALVPALLNEVPIDPFTGKPLVYRREGEGFIVYSLGSNLKDDGGRSTWEIKQLVTEKDDDWTWREDK